MGIGMPVSPDYRPDPRFATLGGEFADAVAPAEFPQATIRFRNQRAAASVGLGALTDDEWRAHFATFEPLPDNQTQPLAMRYHGHQFRVYNPDLGDGRGFLFAQLREIGTGRLLDLGTKGSGQTPWSRTADGRLTLKGGVREVLATAMLEALGVPTSRSFSLIETGEDLERSDEPDGSTAHIRGKPERCWRTIAAAGGNCGRCSAMYGDRTFERPSNSSPWWQARRKSTRPND